MIHWKIIESFFYSNYIAVIAIIITILYFIVNKYKGLPPGPLGLPIVGYWPFLKSEKLHFELHELSKKYGDIFSFRITGTLYIYLGSLKLMREAHITKSECFNERPTGYNIFRHIFGEGIAQARFEEWKTLRKFFLSKLREYGLTSIKGHLAGTIYDSLSEILIHLKQKNGAPTDLYSLLAKCCTQMMLALLLPGVKISDQKIKELLNCYYSMTIALAGKKILATGPLARYVIHPLSFEYNKYLENHKTMQSDLYKIIAEVKSTLDENHPRNIIDHFYIQKALLKKRNDKESQYFTDKALVDSLIALAKLQDSLQMHL